MLSSIPLQRLLRPLTVGITFAVLSFAPAAIAWESAKVPLVNDRLTYPADAEGNRIPDFSHAGYRGANVDIPTITRSVGTIPAGASLAAINAAIASADVSAANPGVLTFAPGTYEIDGTIVIGKSGLVLRGAGDGRDGGPVSLIRQTSPHFGQQVIRISNTELKITNGDASNDAYEFNSLDKTPGRHTTITTPKVPVGSRSFAVASTDSFAVGDAVIISYPCTREWLEAVDPAGWWRMEGIKLQTWVIRFHRYITKISGNTITVDAPVYNTLDRALSTATLHHYTRTDLVTEVGIENLAVEGEAVAPGTTESKSGTRDTIVFSRVENCWVRGVSVSQVARAGVIFTGGSTRCTVENTRVTVPAPPVNEGRAYGLAVEGAQLVLFKDCLVDGNRHAFIANGKTYDSGIVVLNADITRPTNSIEMHRYWGQAMLIDSSRFTGATANSLIRFIDRQGAGLSKPPKPTDAPGHGWSSVHSVIWNCTGDGGKSMSIQKPGTAQNYAIGNLQTTIDAKFLSGKTEGATPGYVEGTGQAGLKPSSLYLAQLADRRALAATKKTSADWSHEGPAWFDAATSINGGATAITADRLTVAFYLTANKRAEMTVINKLAATADAAGWRLSLREDGTLALRIGSDAPGAFTDVVSTAPVYSPFTRVHLSCTVQDGTATLYVNGVPAQSVSKIKHSIRNSTTDLLLGSPSADSAHALFGLLENVQVFNRALTPAEIQALME